MGPQGLPTSNNKPQQKTSLLTAETGTDPLHPCPGSDL